MKGHTFKYKTSSGKMWAYSVYAGKLPSGKKDQRVKRGRRVGDFPVHQLVDPGIPVIEDAFEMQAHETAQLLVRRTPLARRTRVGRQALHQLEQRYGRQRRERWGPRSLDLDLLWWGELVSPSPSLELPHPRWHQRGFVLAPLLAIEARREGALWCPHPAGLAAAVAAAQATSGAPLPPALPAREGWPE